MTTQKKFDIAIIGGGMVGASLALLLAQQKPDWKIALLEAQPFIDIDQTQFEKSFDARSTAIAHGSVEILRELGVWGKLSQHATAISQVHVSDAGHLMGGLINSDTYDLDAVGYVIPNAWIGRVLLESLQQQNAIHYFAPVRVEKLTPQKEGAQLTVKCGDEIFNLDCKLAVVADGGDSPLRKALGIDSHVKHYDQTALIANVAYSEPHKGIAYERFTAQGPLALLPLGESSSATESALVLTLPTNEANDIFALNDADFLQHLQQRFGTRLGKFLLVSQRHIYELKLITASEQIRSRIVLIGNAAHFLHPVAGQGFNLSLRDCVCLVSSLIHGDTAGKILGELSVLQDYLQRQQLDQGLTIEFSDKLVRLFSSSSLPLIALRHLGFVGLDVLPAVKTQFAQQTMGTAGAKFL
ncbi:MAG: 2-octaprenyl-6-methoxyphenyl hydroxylase [Gammaproteobacteria bacterium]|nr:MAG: 2-octaprenyl-6-methoxyphenyl hydroxylase [Gammaproteobacteria bacterium]